ncbi:UNVERIFIED_ORG: hypothetical protein ABIB13_003226 [Arthrobacter sp. UYEF2]
MTHLFVAVVSEASEQARGRLGICGHGSSYLFASWFSSEEGENVGSCVLVERDFLAHVSVAVRGHFDERGAVSRHLASLPVEMAAGVIERFTSAMEYVSCSRIPDGYFSNGG